MNIQSFNTLKFYKRYCFLVSAIIFLGCNGNDTSMDIEESDGQNTEITLQGNVYFEEYIPTDKGLSDEIYVKPVKYALFEVLSENDMNLYHGNLDKHGHFSVDLKKKQKICIKIYSDTRKSDICNVYTVNSDNKVYTYSSLYFNPENYENYNNTISIANYGKISGAFNILDVASSCSKLIISTTGKIHLPLRLTWELGNLNTSVFGELLTTSFFSQYNATPTIYLSGGKILSDGTLDLTSETAHFDDMVIAHEMGHFIQNSYSFDASQGGGHNGNNLYPSLSLSEGFATWCAAACLNNPNYIETIGLPPYQKVNYSNYNIENIDNISYRAYGIQSEFTVSEILWDIYDGSDDYPVDFDNDGLAVDFKTIIDVFQNLSEYDYPFLITVLDKFRDSFIISEEKICELLSSPTDQNIEYPYSVLWPFPIELGYTYPVSGKPYFIGIPAPGTIESEPYLFSGSFFLNQFWSFVIDYSSNIVITFGIKLEKVQQMLTLELYTCDNTLITTRNCKSDNYVQIINYLPTGKYIIKISSYENSNEQYGRYWLSVEETTDISME